jgi:hypothetical protein
VHTPLPSLSVKHAVDYKPSTSATMDNTLYNHPLYKTRSELLENQQRVILAYERAKAVAKTWSESYWLKLIHKLANNPECRLKPERHPSLLHKILGHAK